MITTTNQSESSANRSSHTRLKIPKGKTPRFLPRNNTAEFRRRRGLNAPGEEFEILAFIRGDETAQTRASVQAVRVFGRPVVGVRDVAVDLRFELWV